MEVRPEGLTSALRLHDAPEVIDALRRAMPGWSLEVAPAMRSAPPAIELWREGAGYRQWMPAWPRSLSLPGAASAAGSLIADLIPLALAERPGDIGLHCAAVEVEGRLVLFPATHRAGKSLLSAAFAAAGYRVFGDDVLVLTGEGDGMALGIAPRLRLPLPATLSSGLVDFIAARGGVVDDRYHFLDLPTKLLAAYGERRPLGAIVLLERGTVDGPTLSTLTPGEGLQQLLCQSLAYEHGHAALLERCLPTMSELPCLLLRYDDPVAAVERLVAGLAEGDIDARGGDEAPPTPPLRAGRDANVVPWYSASGGVEYPLGEELFLIDDQGGIHRLNAVAAGIWRLLGVEPLSVDEVVALLAEQYPQVGVERLGHDVARLFDELADARLIASAAARWLG